MVRMPTVLAGIALQKEILRAAELNQDNDGRVHEEELGKILAGEGYLSGQSIFDSATALHAYARRRAGGRSDPSVETTDAAADAVCGAIACAASRSGDPEELSDDEF